MFRQGKNAAQATKAICSVYGGDYHIEHNCYSWFARFKTEDYDINDYERSGRCVETDVFVMQKRLKSIK